MSKKKPKNRVKNRQVSMLMFPRDPNTVELSPLEAFPEHAKLIAYIVAEWSQIEYKLTLWLALRLSADGPIIIPMIQAIESSRTRIDAMAAALRQIMPDEPKARGMLDGLLREASQLLTLRNRYAHAHYGRDNDSDELAIAGTANKPPINIPLHELVHHLNRMKALSHRLAVILAAEFGLPLKGPDAPDSVPAHPLGLRPARIDREPQEPPPQLAESPEV